METTEQPTIAEIVGDTLLQYLYDNGLVVIGALDAQNAAAIIREHPKYATEYAATADRIENAERLNP